VTDYESADARASKKRDEAMQEIVRDYTRRSSTISGLAG
jgi:hypothetical protein